MLQPGARACPSCVDLAPLRKLAALLAVSAVFPGPALAQSYLYPVPWPKAGGGMLVAVPLADAKVTVFRMVGAPHLWAFNRPFNAAGPELSLPQAPRDVPIVLWAPDLPTAANADRDDIFLIASDQRMVVSMADDERLQSGSPDRIFFMPADNGTFLGRTFYSGANGGDPSERLRVVNLGAQLATATVYAWSTGAWSQVGAFTVPPGTDATFDPPNAQSPYKVTTTEDAMVVVGYLIDNATAPAADAKTGLPVGDELLGYGTAWHLRAVTPLSYVVESRASGSTSWTQVTSGTLAADEGRGGQLGTWGTDLWLRIRLTGGRGWAITGTPSLLSATEWNGYYLPTQEPDYCTVGQKFFTNSSARTITMLPRPGTTVTSYDADSGVVVDAYTSAGPWEFHNAFHSAPARVEITNGIGSVLLVGSLNWGGCSESSNPGNCGILEGGYSLPGLSAFRCGSDFASSACQLSAAASCRPVAPDGGSAVDAGAPDAGLPDAGAPDAGAPDGGAKDAGTSGVPADGGARPSGADAGGPAPRPVDAGTPGAGEVVTAAGGGCGCASAKAAELLGGLLAATALLRRRKDRR